MNTLMNRMFYILTDDEIPDLIPAESETDKSEDAEVINPIENGKYILDRLDVSSDESDEIEQSTSPLYQNQLDDPQV